MELVCFGGLIGGFIQKTKDLSFKHQTCSTEDVLKECSQLLTSFRGLKKGFEPLLFILYSTNIVILTLLFYYVVSVIKMSLVIGVMLPYIITFMISGLLLIYTALLAEDGFTAMKDMVKGLR